MAREVRFRKPEFQEKLARARAYERRIGSSRWPRYFLLACALVILYFLTLSKYFLVTEASVNQSGPGPTLVHDALGRLQSRRLWYMVPSNHLLVLKKTDLLEELRKQDPKVRTITLMKKSWPNRLALDVEMRQPRYVWQTGIEYFLLDQDGVIFEQIPAYVPEAFSQPLVVDSSAAPASPGVYLAVHSLLKFIDDIRRQWPSKINETNIVYFSVPALRSKEIVVKTGIGFGIYFDLEREVAEQLTDLRLVLREQIRADTYTGLSYIDLRLPTTAYYCYKDAPCAPEYATSTPAE